MCVCVCVCVVGLHHSIPCRHKPELVKLKVPKTLTVDLKYALTDMSYAHIIASINQFFLTSQSPVCRTNTCFPYTLIVSTSLNGKCHVFIAATECFLLLSLTSKDITDTCAIYINKL